MAFDGRGGELSSRSQAANPDPAETLAPTGHILLADDNADMRAYVERLLSTSGFTVETAAHGEAALEAVRRRRPDLILSDVMMPGLDGFGLLSRIRADEKLKDVPFILLSARAGEEARLEGIRAGADDYLVKPFSARELVGRISASIRLSRDRHEALLRENAARLEEQNADLERRVLEHSRERGRTWRYSPDLLSVIDVETGVFEKVNPAWQKTLGLNERELLSTPFLALLHPEDVNASETAFQAVRRGLPVLRFENRCRTRQGDYRWLAWVAVVVNDKLYSSARDVTDEKNRDEELKKAQETLRQAQKMEVIGQLTGGVAHDFNNLLMVISGGLDILDKRDDPVRRERIKSGMLQAVNRGASLTRQLLTFARRQPLKPQPVDLRHQISEMGELLDRTLGGDITIDVDVDMAVWPIQADPAELELVLLNLCVNARDAMPAGGTIVISASNSLVDAHGQKADVVKITVADSGIGMQPEVLKRVFEPFFTTKEIGKGSGLGLAQVYGFVEASGGSVAINSEPGIGTAVNLWLPRSTEASAGLAGNHSSQASREADRSVAGKILVVEDDDSVAMLVNDMLDQARIFGHSGRWGGCGADRAGVRYRTRSDVFRHHDAWRAQWRGSGQRGQTTASETADPAHIGLCGRAQERSDRGRRGDFAETIQSPAAFGGSAGNDPGCPGITTRRRAGATGVDSRSSGSGSKRLRASVKTASPRAHNASAAIPQSG